MIFYDMDGVLFDTKEAVREAYKAVGLNADNAKGRTWREWLIPKYGVDTAYRLHRNKNDRYVELIERGAVGTLPAFRDMVYGIDKALHNGVPSNIGIATSASKEATRALLKQFLTADQITEEKLATVRALHALALQRGQSLSQLALQWVLRDPVVSCALIGASHPQQITSAVDALGQPPLDDDLQQKILSILA